MTDLAPTVALALPETASIVELIETGRTLARYQRHIDFMAGDLVNHVRVHHQGELDMFLEQIDMDKRYATSCASLSQRFPPQVRHPALSSDHHRAVAILPKDDQMAMLKSAGDGHWDIAKMREAVTQRRYETGQLFEEDDIDAAALTAIVRAWNGASETARREFMQLAQLAAFKTINENKVYADAE
ncbi:hypothetical protein PX699_13420 [Sphingobium sp. H39-3-25]|uniref:hypothetical protein n=1 Tax=Sphingobium arseniciresistens TaxID=3030834 RepID=UPI0023B93A53|nr:hypothetical protein [Sphingobium arseniciresistens]